MYLELFVPLKNSTACWYCVTSSFTVSIVN